MRLLISLLSIGLVFISYDFGQGELAHERKRKIVCVWLNIQIDVYNFSYFILNINIRTFFRK